MKKLRHLSLGLRWRLTGGYVLLLMASLGAVGVFQYLALQNVLIDEQIVQMRSQARSALASMGGTATALSDPRQLAQKASSQVVRAGVYDAAGFQLALTPAGPSHLPWLNVSLAAPAALRPPEQGGLPPGPGQPPPPPGPDPNAGTHQLLSADGAQIVVLTLNLGPARSPEGWLVLEGSTVATNATLREDLRFYGAGAALALVIGGILAAVLTGRSLNRLGLVSRAASAIAAGDLGRRAGVSGPDEVGSLGASFDRMVERLQAEITRQQRSEESMRQFLADASHELRTPLTGLRGTVDVLRRGASSNPADLRRGLEDIHQSSVRMSRLVEDLLALARLDQGSEVPLQPVEVGSVLMDVAGTIRPLAPGHSINVTRSATNLVVLADSDALHRVFMNLLDNARKYAPSGTAITVTAALGPQRQAMIEVHDEGAGIPAQEQKRIFQRFYRGSRGRPGTQGAGLGLSICAAVVERLGGSVEVLSPPGKGCTFVVRLPLA